MWPDPLCIFYGVLESTYVRLVLFIATMFVGGMVGPPLAGTVPIMFASGAMFYLALWSSLVMLAVQLWKESARAACLALAANCLAWCWIAGIVSNALGHA